MSKNISITNNAGQKSNLFDLPLQTSLAPLLEHYDVTAGATMVAAGSISYLAALKFKKVHQALKSRIGI